MMGERTMINETLFYSFRIADHVPIDRPLGSIVRFVDFTGICEQLSTFYSDTGRPSIEAQLTIRMLQQSTRNSRHFSRIAKR